MADRRIGFDIPATPPREWGRSKQRGRETPCEGVPSTESGAIGALSALVIALAKRPLNAKGFWRLLTETGHVTSSQMLLINAANFYSRKLSMS